MFPGDLLPKQWHCLVRLNFSVTACVTVVKHAFSLAYLKVTHILSKTCEFIFLQTLYIKALEGENVKSIEIKMYLPKAITPTACVIPVFANLNASGVISL